MNAQSATLSDVEGVVQEYLNRSQPPNYRLEIVHGAGKRDGEWWHVIVIPDRNGVRAHDYSERLTDIEDEISEKEGIKLLLVPTLVDD